MNAYKFMNANQSHCSLISIKLHHRLACLTVDLVHIKRREKERKIYFPNMAVAVKLTKVEVFFIAATAAVWSMVGGCFDLMWASRGPYLFGHSGCWGCVQTAASGPRWRNWVSSPFDLPQPEPFTKYMSNSCAMLLFYKLLSHWDMRQTSMHAFIHFSTQNDKLTWQTCFYTLGRGQSTRRKSMQMENSNCT